MKFKKLLSAIGFYVVCPIFYGLSLLPFRLLYALSDLVYVVLFHLIRYRRKIVLQNLRNAFPEKSTAEINSICKDFYSYLCDLFLETFKTLTISPDAMIRHCKFSEETKAIFNDINKEGKSAILVLGHLGNWEWAGNTFSLVCNQQLYVIYHPLANKHFNDLMYKMRTRFGTKLIAMNDTFRAMVALSKEVNVTAFIADQTPQPEHGYWTDFLNQDTPVFWGTEKIAKKLNYPVVYIHVKRISRGYYEVEAEILVSDPKSTSSGEISTLHTKRLEKDIIADPTTWLWSHRRWKHKRPAAQTENNSIIPKSEHA
ncbi:lysophospholipid acyltransferase family protein [Pinibacter aurantiacus]|uniref:lysophospholipid acyltransferase family protein n=1 Tax=Pinibacter aurantiacus TaxID=2851599 RepID=UPI001E432FCA|nr:lysophospholipid acyltransferase family protein [Pinibacter aurantiacus]